MQPGDAMTQKDIDGIIGELKQRPMPEDATVLLSKEHLNKVDIVIRDPNLPISADNADVRLNGELLGMVKGFKLELESAQNLGKVTLELWADFRVVNGEGGSPTRGQNSQ